MIKKLRQIFCQHKLSLASLHKINAEPKVVQASCIKCMKTFRGSHGIELQKYGSWAKDLKGY